MTFWLLPVCFMVCYHSPFVPVQYLRYLITTVYLTASQTKFHSLEPFVGLRIRISR
jgi:hypothetical protein